MPKWFALVNVRDVQLDKRHVDSYQGIANRHRRVRQGAGIDNDGVDPLFVGGMDPVNNVALVVGLKRRELEAVLGRVLIHGLLHALERHRPVDGRLSRPQEVEVRSIDEKNTFDLLLDHFGCFARLNRSVKRGRTCRTCAGPLLLSYAWWIILNPCKMWRVDTDKKLYSRMHERHGDLLRTICAIRVRVRVAFSL